MFRYATIKPSQEASVSYEIVFADTIKALFVPLDWGMLLTLVAPPLVMALLLFLTRDNRGVSERVAKVMLILSFVVPWAIIMSSVQSAVGSGWKLDEKQLQINAWPALDTLQISSLRIALEEAGGPWQPIRRTNGHGTPGLSTGWFALRNETSAIAFMHQPSAKILILRSGERWYVLAHPGVEALYKELLVRGAAVKKS